MAFSGLALWADGASERSAPQGSSFGVAQEAPAPRPTIDDLPDDVKRMLGQL